MAHYMKRDIIRSILLIAYLLVYAFSFTIAGDGSMIVVSLIKLALLSLFFIVSIGCKKSNIIKEYKWILLFFTGFVLLQVSLLGNLNSIKILGLNLVVYYIFYKWGNYKLLSVWSWGMKLIAVITAISVVSLSIMFGEIIYYRQDALIDKSFMTTFFSLTFIFCLSEILFKKHRLINFIILVFLLPVNIILVQSKISLVVLTIVFLLGILFKAISKKQVLHFSLLGLFLLLMIGFFLPSESDVLDPLKDAGNRVAGEELFEIKRTEMKSDTYDLRSDIWKYCLNDIFPESPIIGIGLGNYELFAKRGPMSIRDIGETESSLLAVITEGGLVYFILMTSFFFMAIRNLYVENKRYHSFIHFVGISLYVSYMVMMIGNDFLDSLFWIQTGLLTGITYGGNLRFVQER